MLYPPVILLSDFGLQDPYVGVMQGVIARISRDLEVIHLSHGIQAQNIEQARAVLEDNFSYFPPGSVFCCVVDPGVGSQRKAIALNSRSYRFVGPDNGLFSNFLRQPGCEIRELDIPASASRTFHGRDVFAPEAARIALDGEYFDNLEVLSRNECKLSPELSIKTALPIEKDLKLLYSDHFGNLVSNLILQSVPEQIEVYLDSQICPFYEAYHQMPEGQICSLRGSTGRLEFSIKGSNALDVLGPKALKSQIRVKKLSCKYRYSPLAFDFPA